MRALPLLLVSACSVYSPDLGGTPFLCGTSEPRCPDGYVAVDVSVIRCECQKPGLLDAGSDYFCYPDPDEPNEAFSDPTPVPIQPPLPEVFENVSICPGADVDVYRVMIAKVGSQLAVEVLFDDTRQPPRLDLLDLSGGSLHPIVLSPDPGKLQATIVTTYVGAHHVEVRAGDRGEEVNYTLRIQVTEP
jgi:hypothetical protein